ncbi:hypothetical protein JW921_09730 [Candidatus Fermentibacterales bacterium]|nr:hypothetical protein [Candidatus Fermentibacterales bacterium]
MLGTCSFVAGVGLLLSQIVWNRQMLILVGGSVDAAASVLSAFMLGLAAGSMLLGRLAQRSRRPASLLRAVLLLASGFSLLPYVLSVPALGAYSALRGSFLPHSLLRLAVSLLIVFPATFCAGGIIPIMARLIQRGPRPAARESGRLYGLHTLGSALGGLAAGFVLLELMGALLTLLSGMALLLASAVIAPSGAAGESGGGGVEERRGTSRGSGPGAFFLAVYGFSGMLALGYELVWTRQLTFVLGNSTYAFALMGSVVLAGLGSGALLGQAMIARTSRPVSSLGLVEIVLGISSLLPLVSLGWFQPFADQIYSGASWELSMTARLVAVLLFMLPSTACMGATFPLMVGASARRDRMGEDVGALSMANSLGAAVGPVLASMVLFRVFGVTSTTGVLASGSLLIGGALLLRDGRKLAAALAVAPGIPVVWLLVGAGTPPGTISPFPDGELLFFEEDRTATISVFGREWDGYRSLRINGVEEVPIDQASLEAFYLLGNLPFSYAPGADRVLVVALGGGITAGAVLDHPVDTLVCVELCPALVEASALFERENGRPERDPRFRLVGDDGRNYMAAGGSGDWDIVVCDATHPGSADSWVLYTEEFYEDVRERLCPGGIAAQWVPLHQLPCRELERILATWARCFDHCAVHLAGGRHAILIGSRDPLVMDIHAMLPGDALDRLESVALTPGDRDYMAPVIGAEDMVRIRDLPVRSNTDDLAPCQFLRRRVPRDPQATISPNAALLISLGGSSSQVGQASRVREGQILYWMAELPAAAEVLSTATGRIASRWQSVCLTSAAETALLAGRTQDALLLCSGAVEADSSFQRARDLQIRIRNACEGSERASSPPY